MDVQTDSEEDNNFDRAKITDTFSHAKSLYESLIHEAVFILNSNIKQQGIKIHGIEHRLKELNSILEKCSRTNSRDPFVEFSDIAGVRIICLFRSDVEKLKSLVYQNFDVLDIDDKIAESGNPLGYVSIHMTCRMKSEYKGPRYNAISELKFEIQLRTLCMHCWAAVSHYLDYKGEWDVPTHLKLSLNALGGLFYVADNEFEQVYGARVASLSKAEEEVKSSRRLESEIDLDTFTAYLSRKFPERKEANAEAISDLIQQIKASGYSSLADIDRDLEIAKSRQLEVDKQPHFNRVGIVRSTLREVSKTFSTIQREREMEMRNRNSARRKKLLAEKSRPSSPK